MRSEIVAPSNFQRTFGPGPALPGKSLPRLERCLARRVVVHTVANHTDARDQWTPLGKRTTFNGGHCGFPALYRPADASNAHRIGPSSQARSLVGTGGLAEGLALDRARCLAASRCAWARAHQAPSEGDTACEATGRRGNLRFFAFIDLAPMCLLCGRQSYARGTNSQIGDPIGSTAQLQRSIRPARTTADLIIWHPHECKRRSHLSWSPSGGDCRVVHKTAALESPAIVC